MSNAEHPTQGGSYQRDPVTGQLVLVERTQRDEAAGLRHAALDEQAEAQPATPTPAADAGATSEA